MGKRGGETASLLLGPAPRLPRASPCTYTDMPLLTILQINVFDTPEEKDAKYQVKIQ